MSMILRYEKGGSLTTLLNKISRSHLYIINDGQRSTIQGTSRYGYNEWYHKSHE